MAIERENKKIHVKGTVYTVKVVPASELPTNIIGNQDHTIKLIKICDFAGSDFGDPLVEFRSTLRHEIVHAYLYECGLDSALRNDPRGHDEQMVDWIAIIGPELYETWKEADAI